MNTNKTMKDFRALILFAVMIFFSQFSFSTNYYWIGGSGNWNDLSHWSATSGGVPNMAVVPSATDNVFFDVNSFSGAGQTVTINVASICNDMDWTGAMNVPVLSGSSANTLSIYGSLKFISAMTQNFSGKIYFEATTTGKSITMAGKQFSNTVHFSGNGGLWTLMDNFITTGEIDHSYGTLNTNNNSVRCTFLNENFTNARALYLGSSIVTLTGAGSTINPSGLIFNSGASTFIFSGSSAPTLDMLTGNALTFYNLQWTNASITGTLNNGSGNTCNFYNVSFTGSANINGNNSYSGTLSFAPAKTYTLQSAKTQTLNATATLSATGAPANLITINASIPGSQASIYKASGCVSLDYINLQDSKATGGAGFNAGANSIDNGNNTGWSFSTGAVPSISIVANPPGALCSGMPIAFSATSVNGGTSPSWQWKVNGINVGANTSTYTSSTLSSGDSVWCEMTSSLICANPNFVISNIITLTSPDRHLNYNDTTICQGTSLQLAPCCIPNIQTIVWSTGSVNSTISVNQSGNYWAMVTDVHGCARMTDTIVIVVNTPPAAVTAVANPNPVCLGSTLTLTGAGTGVTSWNWSGPNSYTSTAQNPAAFTITTAAQAGIYKLSATNSCGTATATVNVVVNNNVVPSVSIIASPAGIVNYGTNVVYTAYPGNGGTAPVFQWSLNGVAVGTNSITYSNDSLANGDLICCIMTSNAPCANPLTACTSDTIHVTYPGFILAGQVFAGLLPLDNGNSTLSVINGQNITQAGWMNFDTLGYYFFMQQPAADYYVKCEPSSVSSEFGNYAPTYYGDVLNWSNATIINLNMDLYGEDIHLLAIPGPSPGQGQIGGIIQQGAKTGPLAGVEIMLQDNAGNVLTYMNTDQYGGFSFSGIAYGTYIIYPEIAGKTTTPITITISAANPTVTNLVFTVTGNNVVAGVEVAEPSLSFISEIFPNPVNENAAIRLGVKKPTGMQMQVFDITGRQLSEKDIELTIGENEITIDNQKLASGVYRLVLLMDDGSTVSRAFVK
ncbi:MAG: T9SS type A sorting domain-containing protein [Bacteroidota bacterium]